MRDLRAQVGGFTLIEVMVVLAVLAIFQVFAVPAFSSIVKSVRLGSATQSFHIALQLTRSEAIKRNARVVLCKSDNGARCVKTGGWEQGWIVFHDVNNNAKVDAGEPILQWEQPLTGSARLTGNSQVESYVSYTPLGNTNLVSGAFQAGTITACQPSSSQVQGRQVVISSIGRVRTQKVVLPSCA